MQLIVPDVLAEARSLSPGAAGFLLVVGLSLWAAGWRLHQFWIVFGVTLAAGVFGLSAGRSAGGHQVLVVGVLMAVAAGMLALELAKILAFVTGGTAAWVATQAVLPQAQELWAMFLSGGLFGIVLFRLWAMLATSATGCLVAGHAVLVLVGRSGKLDPVEWAGSHAAALNGAVVAAALIGVVVQARVTSAGDGADDPKPASKPPGDKPEPAKEKNEKPKPAPPPPPAPEPPPGPPPSAGGGWKRLLPIPKLR